MTGPFSRERIREILAPSSGCDTEEAKASGIKACHTCRFFAAPRDEYEAEDIGHSLGAPETDDFSYATTGHGTCVRIIHGNRCEPRLHSEGRAIRRAASELAVVTDGSGYAARLLVLPTFGCVLHEPKEAQ